MSYRTRSLTDWLLLRAWIEPDHEVKLRVVMKQPEQRGDPANEQAFADADRAAAFVRTWLRSVQQRWEAGERNRPERRWDAEDAEAPVDERDEGGPR